MQKIVIIALVFLGLGASAVFGSVTKQETMSEAEMQYLFGSSSDDSVSLLSTEEMKEAEGQFVSFVMRNSQMISLSLGGGGGSVKKKDKLGITLNGWVSYTKSKQ